MKQTGTYHVYEVKDNQRVISPIANAFIYFIADGAIKLKTQTDDKGKYNFDLPLGEYTVASSSEGGIEQLLANGSKFILTAQSKVSAFEEWVNAPSADVDSALLKRFKELAKIAEDAARDANEILAQMEEGSLGEGKWIRDDYLEENSDGDGNWVRDTALQDAIDAIPKPDLTEYRKLDNNRFTKSLVAQAVDDTGVGLLLMCKDGNIRGQMVTNNYGLQFSQVQAGGSDQNFTFPRYGDGGEILTDGHGKWQMPSVEGQLVVKPELDTKADSSYVNTELNKKRDLEDGLFDKVGSFLRLRNGVFGMSLHVTSDGVSPVYAVSLEWGEDFRFANFRHSTGTVAYLSDISAMRSTMHTDSNGFLKSASPVLKLFNDYIETNDQFMEVPVFERISEGTYKISNTLGLAQEGWTYEKPRGSDGNPYFRVLVKKTEDGCIISVHDEYDSIEEATITDIDGNTRKINKVVKVLSQARDIKPHERWIDLRFHEEPREETEPTEVVQ